MTRQDRSVHALLVRGCVEVQSLQDWVDQSLQFELILQAGNVGKLLSQGRGQIPTSTVSRNTDSSRVDLVLV